MKSASRFPLAFTALLMFSLGCSQDSPQTNAGDDNPFGDATTQSDASAQSSNKKGRISGGRRSDADEDRSTSDADATPVSQSQEASVKQWVGKPAPMIEVPLMDGGSFQTDASTLPNATILCFWNSEDNVSDALLPILRDSAEALAEQGVQLIALNHNENNNTIREFLDQHHLEIPVAFDLDGEVASQFNVNTLPCVVLLDKQGVVQRVYPQYAATIGREIRQEIRKFLEGKNSEETQSKPVEPESEALESSESSDSAAGVAIWDTIIAETQPLSAAKVIAQDGWRPIPRSIKPKSFDGDAVISNGRLLAVFQKDNPVIDVFTIGSETATSRVKLRVLGPDGKSAKKLKGISVVENTRGAVGLQAVYQTTDNSEMTAKFRIKRGGILLETQPGAGAEKLRIDCPGRFVVLPDFFADDIVIDAQKIPASEVEIPSENYLMHLTGEGDAIAMCVFENSDQDVKVSLKEQEGQREITGSEIAYGEGKKVWLAVMEAPQIWHTMDITEKDANQVKKLDWNMPYTAQWRTDFTRVHKDLTDSWEMLLQAKDAKDFIKPSWLGKEEERINEERKRWTTVLDRFKYPCWTDQNGQGYVQPLKRKTLTFLGPAVIYPINRVEQTPTDAYTVVDVLRNSLGVGPCEYILQVESQKQELKGRATCSAESALEKIYIAKLQREKRQEIEEALDDALIFVTHIRDRIEEYIAFGHELRKYIAEQKKTQPELAEFLTEMDEITAELDERMEARRLEIRTPQFVAGMNEEFREHLISYTGRDAVMRLGKYTRRLTQIGGSQDELVGECRWIVKRLRQRAGILMATNPECAEVAKEIRTRTQQILLKPAEYEGVRH